MAFLGFGGVQLDWIKIRTFQSDFQPGQNITCQFSGYLDGWNKYIGQNCTLEQ